MTERVRAAAVAIAGILAIVAPTTASQAGPDAPQGEIFATHQRGGRAAPAYPPGFRDTVAWSGLNLPTVVQFAPDGRVYVGEKGGTIEEFDGPSDPTPTQVADLSTNVYDYGDRGLLGLALDPDFETNPYLYVLYTLDAPIGQTPPVYGDTCSRPNGDCLAGARLSRMLLDASGMAGPEEVLIEEWCQQFNSHSIGTLAFGPDGALYVGAGDAASYNAADWGQFGNPCADPYRQGGALRAQDLLSPADPTGLDGAILRVDPATGQALPDNPLYGGDPTDDRIIAVGLRNPYRFVVKPNSDSIWIDDVGWNTYEELDNIRSAADATVEDFGWPCYEGRPRQPDYDGADLPICERLYARPGAVTGPSFEMSHAPGGCSGSNVLSGVAFYPGGSYPPALTGALFLSDVVRGCLWVMRAKPNGDPDPSTLGTFATGAYAVDLKPGVDGDLFYVDIYGGSVHRVSYAA